MFKVTKKVKSVSKSRKPKLTWEDVQEDNPTLAAFMKRREDAQKRLQDLTDTEFWVMLIFQSEDQKNEFLQSVKGVPILYESYVDGETFASKLGIKVTPHSGKPFVPMVEKKLKEMVRPEVLGFSFG